VQRELVERLFGLYREPVYRFLRRLLREGAIAEELTQETFVRALGATYRADGRERAWIFQIARNLARDHARGAARREPGGVDHEPASVPDRAAAADLNAAIARLADDDREVFLMRELGGLSYAEIAEACRLTPDAVRSRLHRTRQALRASLTEPATSIRRVRP
jgi:RNA polymerase sigma-70 factor (ECF subfamily)